MSETEEDAPPTRMPSLVIDPVLGQYIGAAIHQMTGQECHVILIAMPCGEETEETVRLGEPTFITSLSPEDMQNVITQIAANIAMGNALLHLPGTVVN